jgi:hypothetical protein
VKKIIITIMCFLFTGGIGGISAVYVNDKVQDTKIDNLIKIVEKLETKVDSINNYIRETR